MLICGAKYSGKKTLISEIIDDSFVYVDNNVDAIRSLEGGNYVFADVDDWSAPCHSAMLQLLEENEHHIILSCKSLQNLPEAVITRCTVEYMEPYKNVPNYCDNIGQLQFFSEGMLKDIENYVYKEEYDLDVYFSVLCNRLVEKLKEGSDVLRELLISSKFNANKSLKSLNKKQFVANWLLDINEQTENWKRL